MKFPDLDYFNLLKKLAISTNILFIFLLLFNYLNFLPQIWNIFYIFYAVVAINTLFFALKIKSIPEDKRKDSKLIYFFGHFFILSLLIIAINQFLKRQIIIDFLGPITALSIAFGFLTFYAYRNKVEKEIEQEQITEQKAEVKRYNEFDKKFPRISKIWGLKHLIRWMYKEGWWYSIGLLAIVILGFVLRVWNLGKLSFWVDETQSIVAAKNLILTGIPFYQGSLIYLRAPFYTLLNALSIYLFGLTEIAIRMLPVFFGILTLLAIYFLIKKEISKKFALLGAFIYSIFSFAILYSRYNRFYIALSLLVLLNIYFFYKGFIEGQRRNKIIAIFFAFVTCGFDSKSAIFFPILLSFLIISEYKKFKETPSKGLKFIKTSILTSKSFIIYCLVTISSFFIFNKIDSINAISGETIRTFREERFMINSPLPGFIKEFIYPNWDNFFFSFLHDYYNLLFIAIAILSLFLLIKIIYNKKRLNLKDLSIYYLTANLIFLSIYTVNIKLYTWDQRHLSFLVGLLVIVFIIFLISLIKMFHFKKIISFSIILFFVLCLSSPLAINSVINMNYGDVLSDTPHWLMRAEPYRSDYKTPFLYVNENYQKGDIIISDFGGNVYLEIYLNNSFDYVFFGKEKDNLPEIISDNENKRIWIIDITYDMKKYHAKYRWGESYYWLESHKDKIVYLGLDNKTRVYLIND